jgi:subtilisin family serine protease
MRLDQLPGSYRGQGVKIAIIDSGAATTHDNLHGIHAGFDVLNKQTNPNGWDQDTLGHGTHCAGVIAAADIASGIRGFAPDAEVHACKLFPGGQISQLIDALEYCIDKQIDVVNLSLGGAEVSEALEQQIIRARRAGIACIVAAGNSGGRYSIRRPRRMCWRWPPSASSMNSRPTATRANAGHQCRCLRLLHGQVQLLRPAGGRVRRAWPSPPACRRIISRPGTAPRWPRRT